MNERQRAVLEGARTAASDEYFGARPQIDTTDRRRVFEAGFDRAWLARPSSTDDLVKEMVTRFLAWKLPKDFSPDAGIRFEAKYNVGTPWAGEHEPHGTNLFHPGQAEEMVRHMLGLTGDMTASEAPQTAMNENMRQLIFEVCNDWAASGMPVTTAMHSAAMESTGDRGKYPHALDTMARLALDWTPRDPGCLAVSHNTSSTTQLRGNK